jgi:hypothetical protein
MFLKWAFEKYILILRKIYNYKIFLMDQVGLILVSVHKMDSIIYRNNDSFNNLDNTSGFDFLL